MDTGLKDKNGNAIHVGDILNYAIKDWNSERVYYHKVVVKLGEYITLEDEKVTCAVFLESIDKSIVGYQIPTAQFDPKDCEVVESEYPFVKVPF